MSPVSTDFVPVPAAGVLSDELDGERLLWNDGRLRVLDPVGSVVWRSFDARSTVAELAVDLATGFGADRGRVRADVARLCGELVDAGYLVPPSGGVAPPAVAPPVDPLLDRPGFPLGPGRVPRRGAALAEVAWVHQSGRFRALDHDFALRTNDHWLGRYLDRRLGVFAAEGTARSTYSLVDTGTPGPGRFETYLGEEGLSSSPDRDLTVRHLLWHVNQEVVHRDRRHLLVHASGAVEDRGLAVVLPGAMNAGKSTLVAGLVRSGLGYLTDELVALDVTTSWIDPYPRSLNLGRGSWAVHPELRPEDWDPENPVPRDLWHVDPRTVGAIAARARLGWVVAPRYVPGAEARLTPVTRPEGVELLLHHAFNRGVHGAAAYRAVVAAVTGARCARLEFGQLEPAVAAVRRLLAG